MEARPRAAPQSLARSRRGSRPSGTGARSSPSRRSASGSAASPSRPRSAVAGASRRGSPIRTSPSAPRA
eukprot:2649112-Alexandrium_andersonii.AAC.1